MYSPVALPSRLRAAPAKNRIWSAPTLTSSEATRALICPVLRLCRSTSSSLFASIASASFSRACAAATVWSVSIPERRRRGLHGFVDLLRVDLGERPMTLPVAGSTSSVNSVAEESTSFPLT